jgi:hypothetical protein
VILGKSIRIYLKDGSVTGIKFGEVVNQTIQSISCPRNRIAELNLYSEAKRPGIYFLFGFDEETNDPKAYIGEAENVFERLQEHVSKKEFWSEVIIFVSKDDNLTKSHVRYLESRNIQIAFSTKRYKMDNYNQSQLPSLPAADRDAMEEFLIYVKLLLGVLGHKLLEELAVIAGKAKLLEISDSKKEDDSGKTAVSDSSVAAYDKKAEELFLNVSGLKARAYRTDEGIVLVAGSEAAKEVQPSLSTGYRELREKLITNGILKLVGAKYIFQENYLFDTASPAAAIVVGFAINGREHWKDKLGRSLKSIESLN